MSIEYKDRICDAYHGELRKYRGVPIANRGDAKYKRIKKLKRYLSRAWAGYSYGRVITKKVLSP
ncbi:hypothetical protein D3C76_260000 [compost metagenome]